MKLPKWIYLANAVSVFQSFIERDPNLSESDLPPEVLNFIKNSKIEDLKKWEREQLESAAKMTDKELDELIDVVYSSWFRAKLMEIRDSRFN